METRSLHQLGFGLQLWFLTLVLVCLVVGVVVGQTPCQVQREENWMGYLSNVLSNKTILNIYLPGTHDSGSYNLSRAVSPDHSAWLDELAYDVEEYLPITDLYPFIRDWANSQNLTFLQQLNAGVRYLDLRVAYDNTTNTFRAHHFLLSYFDLVTELQKIQNWIVQHPSEFIVLHLFHFVSMSDPALHMKLTSYLRSMFKGFIYSTNNLFSLSYSKMISSNQRVVFFYEDIQNYIPNSADFFPTTYLLGDWANTDKVDTLLSYELNSVHTHSGTPNLFYYPQWILTEDTWDIVDSIVNPEPVPRDLHQWSHIPNQKLDEFFDQIQNFQISVLYVDYFIETDVLSRSKVLNLRNCSDVSKWTQVCIEIWRNGTCDAVKNKGFVEQNCPLSCNRCKELQGVPGSSCKVGTECISGQCSTATNQCLMDCARGRGQPCSVGYMCESGVCSSWKCK